MKKILLLSFVILLAFLHDGTAQEMSEGYIKLELTIVDTDNSEGAMMMEMMKGMTIETYFTKEKSLTKMNMMQGMMETTTLINNTTSEMTMLFDMSMMGQKMVMKDKIDKDNGTESNKLDKANMSIVPHKDKKKTIAGYECYLVDIIIKDQPEMKMSAYISEDIKAATNNIKGFEDVNLNGFPLEYTMSMGKMMSLTYTTVKLEKKVDKSVFELDTAGYKEMSMEDFQKQMGGMSGF